MGSRREFLADVGCGMLVAGVGYSTALDLGLSTARAAEGSEANALTFGGLEPLVCLMQDTPVNKLLSALVEKMHNGTELKTLVAAAALANARTFGGEDYIGFHTMMAMMPAYQMSQELPTEKQALPVLKVLYRNTNRIHDFGGRKNEVLHPLTAGTLPAGVVPGDAVRDAVHSKDIDNAEKTFAAAAISPEEAFNAVMYAVDDNTEVHRVVLPYRAYALLDLVGPEQAVTMLRQSVRYCVKSERRDNRNAEFDRPRTLLPKVFDQHKLAGKTPGTRVPDDAWVESFCQTLFKATPDQAADFAGAALAEGRARCDLRSDLPHRESIDSARHRPDGARSSTGQAARQCAWRFDWRTRVGLGECVAEHGQVQQRPQSVRVHDPWRVPGCV